MSDRPVKVTDRALIRYLERVEGVDTRAARRALQHAADVAGQYDGLSAVLSQGVRFILRGRALVTVVCANGQKGSADFPKRDTDK